MHELGFAELHQKLNRKITVYLPPQYKSAPERRYPVLYLHDGQNLFDPATAFLGNDWGLRQTAEELIGTEQIEPLIIVGIDNAGEQRIEEYTHTKDRRGKGGGAHRYGQLIFEELKPFVDREYSTLPDPQNTGLGGSSLGGLVTLFLGLEHRETFGKLIVMSPSVWWANRSIVKYVRKHPKTSAQKIWLDVGTAEGQDAISSVKDTEKLRDALMASGWRLGQDLAFEIDEGARHDERAWGSRMRRALKFLFPPRPKA